MFGWLDAREATEFGAMLAELYDRRRPEEKGANERKQGRQHEKTIVDLLVQVRTFKQGRRLNFYQKARLANRFKWGLLDKGHDKSHVEALTKEVLLALS